MLRQLHPLLPPGDADVQSVSNHATLPPHVFPLRTEAHQCAVLAIDARVLADSRDTLGNFHCNDSAVFATGTKQFVKPVMRMFFMMMYICSNPQWGYEPVEAPDTYSDDQRAAFFFPHLTI